MQSKHFPIRTATPIIQKALSNHQEIIRQRAERFFLNRTQTQSKPAAKKIYLNKTIDEMMLLAPIISPDIVDKFFSKERIKEASNQDVAQTRERLHSIRKTINAFPQEKRFFILQTIDFFNTPANIDYVIPGLMNLDKPGQKHEVLDFIYSTFSTLNKNIETIISIPEMFSQPSLHVERGGLYSLASDIAKSITNLFREEFRNKFKDSSSEVARALQMFKSYKPKAERDAVVLEPMLLSHLLEPATNLRMAVLDFISLIQTHNLLLLYAKKRYAFYKRFLKHILSNAKFNLLESDVSSVILTGCLVTNPQISPPQPLIEAMTHPEYYNSMDTHKAFARFVDLLAPTTIYDLIGDYKLSLREVESGRIASDPKNENDWSAKSIFLKLKERILKAF